MLGKVSLNPRPLSVSEILSFFTSPCFALIMISLKEYFPGYEQVYTSLLQQ
ncbi:hypothetical protein Hanom_Chr09g00789071 [Helianthus anomalus]